MASDARVSGAYFMLLIEGIHPLELSIDIYGVP